MARDQIFFVVRFFFKLVLVSFLEVYLSCDIRFVSAGSLPPDPFKAGSTLAGRTLYVARAWHNGSLIPGKLIEIHDTILCLVCYGLSEYAKEDFEVGTIKNK